MSRQHFADSSTPVDGFDATENDVGLVALFEFGFPNTFDAAHLQFALKLGGCGIRLPTDKRQQLTIDAVGSRVACVPKRDGRFSPVVRGQRKAPRCAALQRGDIYRQHNDDRGERRDAGPCDRLAERELIACD